LFFSGCAKNEQLETHTISVDETIERLEKHTLEDLIQENVSYELAKDKNGYFVAYDVQIQPLIEQRSDIYWYPLYTKTVVLSLDMSNVRTKLETFSDLWEVQNRVGFSSHNILEEEYQILAVDYALSGEELSLETTRNLFTYLNDEQLLDANDTLEFSQDINITTDVDAVWNNEKGAEQEIIVPKDGTLSYVVGIVSMQPLNEFDMITEEELCLMGYRTESSLCDSTLYSSLEQYTNVNHLAVNPNRYRAMKDVTVDWIQKVKWNHLIGAVTAEENLSIYIIFSFVLILWGSSIFYRVNKSKIQKSMLISFVLLMLWLSLQVVRIIAFDPTIERYAWYLSYIPIIFSIFTVLNVAIYLNGNIFRRVLNVGIEVGAIFFILIITNDFHRGMFTFPEGIEKGAWVHEVTVGTQLLMLFLAIYILATFALITYKTRANKSILAPVAVWFPPILLFVFVFLFVEKIRFNFYGWEFSPHELEFVLIQIIIICVSWELQILFGLIPTNQKYRLLFTNLGVKIRIVDHDGKIAIESKGIKDGSTTSVMRMEKVLHYANVIWEVDTTELSALQDELRETREQAITYNNYLEQENKVKRELLEIQIQNDILQRMNKSFVDKLELAKKRVHKVVQGDTSEAEATVAYAEMLLVYIKMRGRLLLQGMADEMLSREAISEAIEAAVYSANFIGLSCEYYINVASEKMYYESALLLYDCIEEILEKMVLTSQSIVVIFIEEQGENIVLRILLEGSIREECILELINAFKYPKTDLNIKRDEDGMHFVIKIPREVD
jgi:hypothetical protein